MAAFDDLPSELVVQIFSRIKYEDCFETSKVSYKWFFLTLKTYEDEMTPKNDLLVSMADFFNKAMGAKKYSSWMQLFRYMRPTKAEISSSDSLAYIKAVDKCKPSIKFMVMDMGLFLTEFWKSYPNLRSIDVRHGVVPKDKVKILKDAFGSLYIPQLVYHESSGHCFDFRLKRFGSSFALSKVVLMFGPLPRTILSAALKALKESKTVETFFIINPVITAKWKNLFPSSVRRLSVIDPLIKDSVVAHLKDLLFHLCKDWSSLALFDITERKVTKYYCIPKMKEERIDICWPENPSHFTNGFKCLQARIDGLRSVNYFKNSLPATVGTLELKCTEFPKGFSLRQLFSGPPELHTLHLEMSMVNNISFGDFSGLASLHTLLLPYVERKILPTIFSSLPMLKEFATRSSEEGTFTYFPMEVVSKSLKALSIKNTSVNNSFIVRHVPNLKHMSIHDYDPKKHSVGFLCSSYYNLDLVIITGNYDPLLCRAIGSDLADYPYKCIIADWRFPSICYTYVLSRKVGTLRSLVLKNQARCIQKMTLYAHGFSVAFLRKKPNLEIYYELEQFLNIVD